MNTPTHTAPVADVRRFKRYPENKESGVDWLGDIPKHWEVKRLRSTVLGCQNGLWGEEPDGVHDIACIRVADFDRVGFAVDIADPTFRSIEPSVASARGLRAGDLLLEKSGGGENQPVGAVVMFDHQLPAICSNFIARLTIAEGNDSRFLTYLNAALYAQRINTRHIKQSTGIQNLDSSSYLCEVVALPPLSEQCTIAAFLDRKTATIDALVAKKERLIELLQQNRIACITHAVTKGLDPNVSTKDSGVEWLGEIPLHWEVKRLWHLTPPDRRIMYGIVLPGPDVDDGVPIVKGGDVSNERLCLDRLNKTTHEIEAGYVRSRLRGGDLVYAIRGSIGEVALVPDELEGANLTQDAARISYTAGVHGLWLLHALKSLVVFAQLEAGALGATIRGINIRDLKRASIPVPPIAEQRDIATYLVRETAKIDVLAANVRDAIDRLRELRTALISAAVTGKIDVRGDAA